MKNFLTKLFHNKKFLTFLAISIFLLILACFTKDPLLLIVFMITMAIGMIAMYCWAFGLVNKSPNALLIFIGICLIGVIFLKIMGYDIELHRLNSRFWIAIAALIYWMFFDKWDN